MSLLKYYARKLSAYYGSATLKLPWKVAFVLKGFPVKIRWQQLIISSTPPMSHSWCVSPLHPPFHYVLPSEELAAGSPRNVASLSLPVHSATLQEPPLLCSPTEVVPHLPAPSGSTAVRGRCRPCASPGQAWLPHGSEAPVHLVLKLWNVGWERHSMCLSNMWSLRVHAHNLLHYSLSIMGVVATGDGCSEWVDTGGVREMDMGDISFGFSSCEWSGSAGSIGDGQVDRVVVLTKGKQAPCYSVSIAGAISSLSHILIDVTCCLRQLTCSS